ncbi:MAG: AI-2E family transporter [Oscillospiraceae bacterium]|nr:AI-2E family transporter [Oscillospiraceae bacterium]
MRRHFRWDKKYLYWGVTAFLVVAASILFYMALNYMPALGKALQKLARILNPFIWGLVFTYLLTPLMRSLEKNCFYPLGKKLHKSNEQRAARFGRGLSVLVSIIVLLAVLAALVYMILPQLYSSIETIVTNSPAYLENLGIWVEQTLKDFPAVADFFEERLAELNSNLGSDLFAWIQTNVLPQLGSFVTNVTSGVYSVVRAVYNLVIGIIVSIYLLNGLEHYGAAFKRVLYSLLNIESAEKLLEGIRFTDRTFIGFINGKLLDSAIIGLICYIVCAILKMPYTLLVSVIIGITNIIPFFGPLIGAVPSAFIILMVDPLKCLIFIIFIILLQQVDGNFIGPKILGNSVGISGFWVMFSIILGAGLFSFWGMLLGVPVFVVIYTLINSLIEKKLRRSDLPVDVAEYRDLDHIDAVTRQSIRRTPPSETAEEEKPTES